MITIDEMLNPQKHNLVECPHCNGYGSSLKEESERCTLCKGTGLVLTEVAEEYKTKEAV